MTREPVTLDELIAAHDVKVTSGYRAKWAADAEAHPRTTVDTARLSGANPFSTILGAASA